jgi:hypothetical protein
MTRFDFILYAFGFLVVGFTFGAIAGAAYYNARVAPILRRIADGDLAREESVCR